MTLAQVDVLSREQFIEKFGWVLEDSPWVAERAWKSRPFASVEALHGALIREVEEASGVEQLQLLRAHPDLGKRTELSVTSAREQKGAGLDSLDPAEMQNLLILNLKYREKFGYPFLFAVKGRSKRDILQSLEERLDHDLPGEFAEALRQVYRIAWFRLRDLIEA